MNTLPFRDLCLSLGADYVFSEEIIDKKLISCVRIANPLINTIDYVTCRGGDYSLVLCLRPEQKSKFILQIGTNSAETAVMAVERVVGEITGVDVNMGCPKAFSTQGGMGAALMKDLGNAKAIMKALVERFKGRISVSCKIRVLRSWEDTVKYILAMQDAGVDWITIHPRTAAEETRVPARWYSVKNLLSSGLITIPILGSGDLFSPLDVHKYLTSTGASGVILARGAIHNPGIFLLKSSLLDRSTPLLADFTESEDDWKDNIVEPVLTAEQKLNKELEEDKRETQRKPGSAYDDESIEFSQNLVKVYERRYSRYPMQVDIIEYVKKYFRLSVECGNHY
jgi:tRNA-dihydrouridine synthase 2